MLKHGSYPLVLLGTKKALPHLQEGLETRRFHSITARVKVHHVYAVGWQMRSGSKYPVGTSGPWHKRHDPVVLNGTAVGVNLRPGQNIDFRWLAKNKVNINRPQKSVRYSE